VVGEQRGHLVPVARVHRPEGFAHRSMVLLPLSLQQYSVRSLLLQRMAKPVLGVRVGGRDLDQLGLQQRIEVLKSVVRKDVRVRLPALRTTYHNPSAV
jgi:hypothetical protein